MKIDEWIIGEGLESPGRWYVLHTAEPMFLVEVCDEDEASISGLTWRLENGQIAQNLIWYAEEVPPQKSIDEWVFRVSGVMDDYDVRVERRNERGLAAEEL